MTATHVFLAGALGGVAAVLCLLVCVGLASRLSRLIVRALDIVHERKESRRRRRDHDLCKAIFALPTVDHPTEPR